MRRFLADLHIHTCLSPCAELEMTPLRIVHRAVAGGMDIIAVSDHNSAQNIEAALEVAAGTGLVVLPAMEITSFEEAHVLAVFRDMASANRMQEKVYAGLHGEHNSVFGEQVVVNAAEEVLEFCLKPLISASDMGLSALVEAIHSEGGLAIASHVDREAFSVISQLGFIPPDVEFDALEVINPVRSEELLGAYPGVPCVCSSDAHRLEDLGARTTAFYMEAPTFDEIGLALKGEGGRSVKCC